MAFWDNLGKKISTVAGTAADKAKDLGEIAKLKTEIAKNQSGINGDLLVLGRTVYEAEKNNAESPYAEICAKIAAQYTEIENLRARIALVKADESTDCIVVMEEENADAPRCADCGAILAEDAAFCQNCGKKQE